MNNICLKHTVVKDFSPDEVGFDAPEQLSGSSANVLQIVTEMAFSEDITIGKLRFALHALSGGLPPDSYSNQEIAHIVGKSERTSRTIRKWANSSSAFDTPCVRKIAACSALFSKLTSNLSTNSNHEEIEFLSREWRFALERLHGMKFNSFEGAITVPKRSARTTAWIDRWGISNVLHAIWIAESPKGAKRNKAGFVRTLVESGRKAPDGWAHPELTDTRPAVPPSPDYPVDQIPPPEPPSEGKQHTAALAALRSNTRPATYANWFKDLVFVDRDNALICWCPTPIHLAAVTGPYREKLTHILADIGLSVFKFETGRCAGAKECETRSENCSTQAFECSLAESGTTVKGESHAMELHYGTRNTNYSYSRRRFSTETSLNDDGLFA